MAIMFYKLSIDRIWGALFLPHIWWCHPGDDSDFGPFSSHLLLHLVRSLFTIVFNWKLDIWCPDTLFQLILVTHFLPIWWLTNDPSTAQFYPKIAFLVMNGSILIIQTHTLSFGIVMAELTTMVVCWYFQNSTTLLPLYGWSCPSASLVWAADCIFTIYYHDTNHSPLLDSWWLLVVEITIPSFWFYTHFRYFCRY